MIKIKYKIEIAPRDDMYIKPATIYIQYYNSKFCFQQQINHQEIYHRYGPDAATATLADYINLNTND